MKTMLMNYARLTNKYSKCIFQFSSIHPNQIEAINNDLENDRMVR